MLGELRYKAAALSQMKTLVWYRVAPIHFPQAEQGRESGGPSTLYTFFHVFYSDSNTDGTCSVVIS